MPSNQIVINKALEYFVGDSEMDELLEWLESNKLEAGREDGDKDGDAQ